MCLLTRLLDFNGDGLKDVAWMKAYGGGDDNYDQKFYYAENTGQVTGLFNRNFHSGHTLFPYKLKTQLMKMAPLIYM